VVFLFTKPAVSLLARTRFFGGGHRLSGFDPEHLGRTVVYAGRGRVRAPAGTGSGTIAERRAAKLRASETEPGSGASPDSEEEGDRVLEVEAPDLAPDGELAGSTKGRNSGSSTRSGSGKES
jgi:preprotein translocase subunit SecD